MGGHTDWTAVSVGAVSTCGIRSGHLFCWGAQTFGALGNGRTDVGQRNAPVEVAGGAGNWASVSVGAFGACAQKTTHRIFCFGWDDHGQVGDGPALVSRGRPTNVADGASPWSVPAAGADHRCAPRADGTLLCWGSDQFNQLGTPGQTNVDRAVPTQIDQDPGTWAGVSGGATFTCAIQTDHTLWCWGDTGADQTGNNSPFPFEPHPVLVAGGFTDWQSVSLGDSHACAIRAGGSLYCWGRNDEGQTGTGPLTPTVNVPVPTQVAP